MPNIIGSVDHPENPEWMALRFDDGSQSPWAYDPSGQFRQESAQIAGKVMGQPPPNALAGAVAGPGGGEMAPPLPSSAPLDAATAQTLTASPADLAGLRRGLGEVSGNAGAAPVAPAPPGAPAPPAAPYVLPQGAIDMDAPAALGGAPSVRSAPSSSSAPVSAGGGAAPLPAAAAGEAPVIGSIVSDKTRGSTGYDAAGARRIDQANAASIEAQRKADETHAAVRTEQVNNEWTMLTAQQKQLLAQSAVLQQRQRDYDTKVSDATTKLTTDLNRKIDPSGAFGGDAGFYAFMAGLGDSLQNFGAALAGRGPVANPGATVDRIIDRYVTLQTQQKEAAFKAGRITVDQLTADRETIRARMLTVQKQMTDNMLARAKTQDERIGLKASGDDAEAKRQAAIAKAAEATARHDTVSDSTKTTAEVGMSNETTQALRAVGVTPKSYGEGMEKKTGAGEASPTLAQAIPQLEQLRNDRQALESIAKNNDGKLPGKGAIRIPRALIPTLSRMGWKPGMEAEEVRQMLIPRIIAQAKAMGSRVTEKELDIAGEAMGDSTPALFRALDRVESSSGEAIKATAEQQWPGAGQRVLDIHRKATGAMTGIPKAAGIEDYGPHTGTVPKAPPTAGDVAQAGYEEHARQTRERAKHAVGDFFAQPSTPDPNTSTGME